MQSSRQSSESAVCGRSVTVFGSTGNTLWIRGIPELQQSQSVQEAEPERQPQRPSYVESKQNLEEDRLTDQNQVAASRQDTRARQPQTPIVKDKLPGRNDPCPCGSGKKFKNCHGKGLV